MGVEIPTFLYFGGLGRGGLGWGIVSYRGLIGAEELIPPLSLFVVFSQSTLKVSPTGKAPNYSRTAFGMRSNRAPPQDPRALQSGVTTCEYARAPFHTHPKSCKPETHRGCLCSKLARFASPCGFFFLLELR